ncbi:hypothetical protein [Muricoccus radiodurans]|uniref:hypothetical protein n=1 Tax=Muricoccus radiodurans TaxID=2231721 RepID=UPI003CF59D04
MRQMASPASLLAGAVVLMMATARDTSAQPMPTTYEDALMMVLNDYSQEVEAGNPNSWPRVTSVTRRPGHRRDMCPPPNDGSTMYDESSEMEVTGCSAVLRTVRRQGRDAVRQENRVDVRAYVGFLRSEGAAFTLRAGRYGTAQGDDGDGRPSRSPLRQRPRG